MNPLDRLLEHYRPPEPAADLAARAAAAAASVPQALPSATPWPRGGERRGGWRRRMLAGGLGAGLLLSTAVTATVVSGGRIAIPVAREVVAAIPVLEQARQSNAPVEAARAESPAAPEPEPQPEAQGPPEPSAEPGPAETQRTQRAERLEALRETVEARRAAGLPTPHADRIERRATAIVERRQARGLPTLSPSEVEELIAARELRAFMMLRRLPADPALIGDRQVMRFTRLLPPAQRARFAALDSLAQRQLMASLGERARRGQDDTRMPPGEGFVAEPR